MAKEGSAEATIRDIKRRTWRKYNAEEKIRIVIEGLRGEECPAVEFDSVEKLEGVVYTIGKNRKETLCHSKKRFRARYQPRLPKWWNRCCPSITCIA